MSSYSYSKPVITSVSMLSSLSLSLLSLSESIDTSGLSGTVVFLQSLQLHPGTHGDPFLTQLHLIVVHPFLQEQPFMRKSIVSCICCWSWGHSQSTEYSLLWIFHSLCSGGGSAKGPCSWALWQSCATQQERSQCHHIEVCECILSSVSMVQSACGLSLCSELSIYIIRNIWTKLVVVLHGSQIVLWLGIALHAICI